MSVAVVELYISVSDILEPRFIGKRNRWCVFGKRKQNSGPFRSRFDLTSSVCGVRSLRPCFVSFTLQPLHVSRYLIHVTTSCHHSWQFFLARLSSWPETWLLLRFLQGPQPRQTPCQSSNEARPIDLQQRGHLSVGTSTFRVDHHFRKD